MPFKSYLWVEMDFLAADKFFTSQKFFLPDVIQEEFWLQK